MTSFRQLRRSWQFALACLVSLALLTSAAVTMDAAVAGAVTGAPTGLTPNDDVPHKNPILRWTPVDGAASYEVQVSPNPSFTNNLTIDKTGVLIPQYALPATLPHASYFWRVRVAPVTGTPGPWSETADITRGWIDKPGGLAYDKALGRFTWNAIPDASAYEIDFSTVPDFPAPPIQQSKASTPPATDVAAVTDGENVADSGSKPLTVDGVTLADGDVVLLKDQDSTNRIRNGVYVVTVVGAEGFTLSAPQPGSFAGDLVHVTGGDTNGDTLWVGDGAHYKRYVGTNSCVVNHPAYSFEFQPAGKVDVTDGSCLDWATFIAPGVSYFWRARGRDGTDAPPLAADTNPGLGCVGVTYENGDLAPSSTLPECSRWSTSGKFTLSPGAGSTTTRPVAPTGVIAAGDCTGHGINFACGDTPALQWSGDVDAASYTTYVALDAAFTNVQYVYDSPMPSVSPAGSWFDNSKYHAYFVGVQSCNAAGLCGDLTVIHVAKHSDPVTLLQPVTTATPVDSRSPRFVWTDFLPSGGHHRQEARDYRLQVAVDATFTTPLEDVTIDREGDVSGQAEYTSPDKVYPDGTLYWRVAPVDGSKNLLSWTTPAGFVKDTSGATATITTPNGVSILGPITVTFSQPVTGVTSTSLGLVLVGTPGTVSATVTVLSVTSASIKPTTPLVPGGVYGLTVASSIKDGTGNSAVASVTTVRTSTTVTPGSPALREYWDPDVTTSAFGGGYEKSATLNDTSSLLFHGTSVSLSGPVSRVGGYAHVYVDGVYKSTISFYAAATAWKTTVWTSSALSDAYHRVSVVVTATHAVASGGNYVYIDQWTVGTTTYQEASGDATHSSYDAWSRQVATDATARVADLEVLDNRYLNGGLPTATTPVSGATVTVKLCRTPKAGYAYVYVDGARRATVSLYQSFTSCGYTAYTGTLTPGVHSVGVGVTGIVPSGSGGSAVGLDAVSVT